MASFTIAVDKWGSEKGADFLDCSAWRQQAEFIAQYGAKGRMVAVRGRVSTRTYDDREGKKRKVVEITADEVGLLDRPKEDAQDADDEEPF